MPAHYAFYYADIFDGGLVSMMVATTTYVTLLRDLKDWSLLVSTYQKMRKLLNDPHNCHVLPAKIMTITFKGLFSYSRINYLNSKNTTFSTDQPIIIT